MNARQKKEKIAGIKEAAKKRKKTEVETCKARARKEAFRRFTEEPLREIRREHVSPYTIRSKINALLKKGGVSESIMSENLSPDIHKMLFGQSFGTVPFNFENPKHSGKDCRKP